MIKDNMTPFQFRVSFSDAGVERVQYTDDRRFYERLAATHGHITGLIVETLVLTTEQETRLAEIASAGLSGHDASIYVRFGTTESEDTGFFNAAKLLDYRRSMVEPLVRAQRKAAERQGVTLNGVRYAGDPGNRQALQEAILSADDGQLTAFSAWKDSDNQFHQDHPVADVKDALRAIGQRRSALIALESLYVGQVVDELIDIHELDWSTEYD